MGVETVQGSQSGMCGFLTILQVTLRLLGLQQSGHTLARILRSTEVKFPSKKSAVTKTQGCPCSNTLSSRSMAAKLPWFLFPKKSTWPALITCIKLFRMFRMVMARMMPGNPWQSPPREKNGKLQQKYVSYVVIWPQRHFQPQTSGTLFWLLPFVSFLMILEEFSSRIQRFRLKWFLAVELQSQHSQSRALRH